MEEALLYIYKWGAEFPEEESSSERKTGREGEDPLAPLSFLLYLFPATVVFGTFCSGVMAASAAAGRGAAVPGKRECVALLGALLVVVALAEPAAAAEYTVGDATRWTTLGSPNYTAWAASKTFRVGDTIVFLYNNQFHNVLEVSQSRYNSCNIANPISTHATGNDSFILNTAGHRYFLCGIPGHCASGQRVDVNVLSSSTPVPVPASAPSTPATPSVPSASSPSPSAASPSPPSAASPSVGSGHYVAGCFVALLAAVMALSL